MFESGEYFRKRESQERDLAQKAQSAAIRNIHLEMAERYRQLAGETERPALQIVRKEPGARG